MNEMIRNYKKGEVIFFEGTFESAMYHLVEGTVGIYANYGKPEQKLLTELQAENGATFGEMGLLDSKPRSATAVALEDVKIYYITEETFDSYFRELPAAVLLIMRNMSKRIRELTEDYLDACSAVAESVETEKTGKAKSSSFMNKVSKFIKDYEEGAKIVSKYGGSHYSYYLKGYFW